MSVCVNFDGSLKKSKRPFVKHITIKHITFQIAGMYFYCGIFSFLHVKNLWEDTLSKELFEGNGIEYHKQKNHRYYCIQ